MTASASTTSKADGNGEPEPTVKTERRHGAELLREQECYYLTGLIEQCLSEAQRLVYKLHREVADRFTDYDGSKGTEPLDLKQVLDAFDEVHACSSKAMAYIQQARTNFRPDNEPPF